MRSFICSLTESNFILLSTRIATWKRISEDWRLFSCPWFVFSLTILVCLDCRVFSNEVSCGRKSIAAILVINVQSTVTIAIDVNRVAFRSVSKKGCPWKVMRRCWLTDRARTGFRRSHGSHTKASERKSPCGMYHIDPRKRRSRSTDISGTCSTGSNDHASCRQGTSFVQCWRAHSTDWWTYLICWLTLGCSWSSFELSHTTAACHSVEELSTPREFHTGWNATRRLWYSHRHSESICADELHVQLWRPVRHERHRTYETDRDENRSSDDEQRTWLWTVFVHSTSPMEDVRLE